MRRSTARPMFVRPSWTRPAGKTPSCGGTSRGSSPTTSRAGTFLEQPVVADMPDPSAGRATLVGRQHGPYRILSLLGAGGMGEVYQAHDVTLGRDVALKTLPPEFALDPARLARFRREARALAALNHPNIETIHGLEESADLHFLVLELVEGETPRGPLPLAEALDLASQVAGALQAAHEHGIVHRDLKPANLKVTPQGRLKVLDFGLAKAIAGAADAMPAPAQSQADVREGSVLGHVVGTPGYMSPEQARGAEVDQRTDIWAFGCLLYELLTGKRAFEIVAGAGSAAAAPGLDWQSLPEGTPDRIRELLRRCLQEDPERRLQTMAEARAAIEEVRPSPADTHGEPPRTALPPERGRRWLTAALLRPAGRTPAAAERGRRLLFAGLAAGRQSAGIQLEPRRRLELVRRGGERCGRAGTPGQLEEDAAAPLLVAGRPLSRVRAADTEDRPRDARSPGRRTKDLAVGPRGRQREPADLLARRALACLPVPGVGLLGGVGAAVPRAGTGTACLPAGRPGALVERVGDSTISSARGPRGS